MGSTPIQYITQKKMEKAQLILVTQDISIKTSHICWGMTIILILLEYLKNNWRNTSRV